MSIMLEKIAEAVSFIKSCYSFSAEIGIVLGSGLGNFVEEMTVEKEIYYRV